MYQRVYEANIHLILGVIICSTKSGIETISLPALRNEDENEDNEDVLFRLQYIWFMYKTGEVQYKIETEPSNFNNDKELRKCRDIKIEVLNKIKSKFNIKIIKDDTPSTLLTHFTIQ